MQVVRDVPGSANIAYLSNTSCWLEISLTPSLNSNAIAVNCQAVSLESALSSSQFSGGHTIMGSVHILTGWMLVHSLLAGGNSGITPVLSNDSALSFSDLLSDSGVSISSVAMMS